MSEREDRLKAIRAQKELLRQQENAIMKEIDKEKELEEKKRREMCVGKCFKLINPDAESSKAYGKRDAKPYMMRILSLSPTSEKAMCLVIRKDKEDQLMVGRELIDIWDFAEYRRLTFDCNKRVIDLYTEISSAEFSEEFHEAMRSLSV